MCEGIEVNMEMVKKNKVYKYFFAMLIIIMAYNILIVNYSVASTSVPSRKVLSEFKANDSEKSIIGRIFFRYPVQYIWAYPNVSSDIIFIYVRPIGMIGTKVQDNPIFSLSESLSIQKDFSGIFDKIEYEGSILDGGFIIIHLTDKYVHSVHQGDKFESVAIIIHKYIPEGSINSEKLELIEEKN